MFMYVNIIINIYAQTQTCDIIGASLSEPHST